MSHLDDATGRVKHFVESKFSDFLVELMDAIMHVYWHLRDVLSS